MQRNTLASGLAMAAMLAVLAVGVARKTGRQEVAEATPASPEDVIYATRNAARDGDIKRYLDGYTGEMRAALQRSLDDTGRAAFAQYLRNSNAGVKGLAVQLESATDASAKVRVEYIYQDRNDRQTVYLEKERGVWRIARTEGDQQVKSPVPYGTPLR